MGTLRPRRAIGCGWCASFLMLFVELALIRWTSANNIYLAYFTNFVLLASFLGHRPGLPAGQVATATCSAWRRWRSPLLVAFVLVFPVLTVSRARRRSSCRRPSAGRAAAGLVSLPVIFLLTVAGPDGDRRRGGPRLRRCSGRSRPTGWTSWAAWPGSRRSRCCRSSSCRPSAWGLIACGGARRAARPRRSGWWQVAALARGRRRCSALESLVADQTWSPYYKLSVTRPTRPNRSPGSTVNNIPLPDGPAADRAPPQKPFYLYPYRHIRRPALTTCSSSARAPATTSRSRWPRAPSTSTRSRSTRELHAARAQPHTPTTPTRARGSPRTSTTAGRSSSDTNKHYDLILFALPDSLTLVAGQSACGWRATCSPSRRCAQAASAPRARRHVRDVQLLRSRSCSNRYANTIDARVRPCAVRRARAAATARRQAGRADRARRGRRAELHHVLARPATVAAGHRRPPVPLPADAARSRRSTCGCSALILLALGAAGPGGGGPLRADAAATSTCPSWAPRSCCWRPRTSSSSRCCSAPPGS